MVGQHGWWGDPDDAVAVRNAMMFLLIIHPHFCEGRGLGLGLGLRLFLILILCVQKALGRSKKAGENKASSKTVSLPP